MTFNYWGSIANILLPASGQVDDVYWSDGDSANASNPVWVADETALGSYLPWEAVNYGVYLSSEDATLDQAPALWVASTTVTDPYLFVDQDVSGVVTYTTTASAASGAVFWLQNDASKAGALNVEYETYTDTYNATSPGTLKLSGTVTTIASGIQNLVDWKWASNSNTLLIGFEVTTSTSNIDDIYILDVKTGKLKWFEPIVAGTQWSLEASGSGFVLQDLEDDSLLGSLTFGTTDYNASTGEAGNGYANFVFDDQYSAVYGESYEDTYNASGKKTGAYFFVDADDGGADDLIVYYQPVGTTGARYVTGVGDLGGAGPTYFQTVGQIYDYATDAHDLTALAFTYQNQVYLELFNSSGVEVGGQFAVPHLTSFTSLHVLGSRIEIVYEKPNSSGGYNLAAVIYDTASSGVVYNLPANFNSEWAGTPYNDTVTDNSGTHLLNGGGGSDTLIENFDSILVRMTIDSAGQTVLVTPGGTTTLVRFSEIQFLDATVKITGNSLDEVYKNNSNSYVDYTFNITGKPYTSSMLVHSATGSAWGGGYNVTLQDPSADVVYLSGTDDDWDTLSGSNTDVRFTRAQAVITGGNDTIYLDPSNLNYAALISTNNAFDTVNGSNGKIGLTKAQAKINGGNDTVYLDGSNNDSASLFDTSGAWDAIHGSNAHIGLTQAQATIDGADDTISLDGSNTDIASLDGTNNKWDTVNGSNGVIDLANAQAYLNGSHDTVNFTGANSLSAVGDTDTFAFQAAIGLSTIAGFNSSDFIELATTDFASWSVLKGHLSEVSGNAVITLDANDKITLTGVALASLTKADFEFV